jgi:four helix bundle protein
VSIASNIAEGAARQSTKELVQFLYVASGSASELLTQLEIAKAVVPAQADAAEDLKPKAVAVARMLRALIKSLKSQA